MNIKIDGVEVSEEKLRDIIKNNPQLIVESRDMKCGFEIIKLDMKCPKCGWGCYKNQGLVLNFKSNIDGEYCMMCWSKKMVKGVPKMEKK